MNGFGRYPRKPATNNAAALRNRRQTVFTLRRHRSAAKNYQMLIRAFTGIARDWPHNLIFAGGKRLVVRRHFAEVTQRGLKTAFSLSVLSMKLICRLCTAMQHYFCFPVFTKDSACRCSKLWLVAYRSFLPMHPACPRLSAMPAFALTTTRKRMACNHPSPAAEHTASRRPYWSQAIQARRFRGANQLIACSRFATKLPRENCNMDEAHHKTPGRSVSH